MAEDIRPETIRKVIGLSGSPKETISDVKKQAENINVIDETIAAARKLAGSNALEEELKRKDDRMEKVEKEKDKATEELHESQMQNVKTELGSKIDELAKSIQSGASPKSIADEISEIKKAANELGMGGSKISELKDIMNLISTLNPKTNLAEQVKEAKGLLIALQPEDKKPEGNVEGVPASIVLEVKKMDHNLQITLEQMKDERQQRDQQFQLTLRKYDEERLSRQERLQMDYSIQQERNQILSGGLQMLGRAGAKAYAETLGKTPQGARVQGAQAGAEAGAQKSYHIELNEGEAGTNECPHCKSPVGVGPTTEIAECVGCHSKFEVVRVAPAIKPEED